MKPYRHMYQDPRVDEAYRLYVDGKIPLRQLTAIAGISTRTLSRYSSRDAWADERAERLKAVANGHAIASVVATLATEGVKDIETLLSEALCSDDQRQRIAGVMTQQRLLADRFMSELNKLVSDLETKNERIPTLQLFAFAGLLEKIAATQRRAHGIPDVSKMEIATGECANCARTKNMTSEQIAAEIEELEREEEEAAARAVGRKILTAAKSEESSN